MEHQISNEYITLTVSAKGMETQPTGGTERHYSFHL